MDQVIARLLEVDKAAAKMVDDARVELEKMKDAMESEKLEFKQTYLDRAKRRIELLKQEEDDHLQKACAELDAYYRQRQQKLQDQFDQRHQEWEQKIFERCITQ